MKRILTIELDYDAELHHGGDSDPEAKEWFEADVLGGPLILHSCELGDEIGTARVIESALAPSAFKPREQGGEMLDDAGERYQAEKEGIEAALAFCYPGRPASELAATAHKIQSDMHAVALRALLARESAEPAEELGPEVGQ